MPRVIWDDEGDRVYESGTDRGMFYVKNKDSETGKGYDVGEAWNGITAFTSSPSGAEVTKLWADNRVYAAMTSAEEYGATIEAYTYPDGFADCDGSRTVAPGVFIGQQNRKKFGFAVRTMKGNDTDGYDHGYILHLIWNCTASTTERSYATQNDSPEAITFSWTITTEPVTVTSTMNGAELKPTAHIEIDTTKLTGGVNNTALKALEDLLYGTDGDNGGEGTQPMFPADPDEVIGMFTASSSEPAEPAEPSEPSEPVESGVG